MSQRFLLAVIFRKSNFSLYFRLSFFCGVYYSFCLFLKAFLLSSVGLFRNFVASSDRDIIAFHVAFVTYGLLFALIPYFFLGACISISFSNIYSKCSYLDISASFDLLFRSHLKKNLSSFFMSL